MFSIVALIFIYRNWLDINEFVFVNITVIIIYISTFYIDGISRFDMGGISRFYMGGISRFYMFLLFLPGLIWVAFPGGLAPLSTKPRIQNVYPDM